MSGKLHLICMKTEGFHAKIYVFFKKIRFQLIICFAHLDYDVRM